MGPVRLVQLPLLHHGKGEALAMILLSWHVLFNQAFLPCSCNSVRLCARSCQAAWKVQRMLTVASHCLQTLRCHYMSARNGGRGRKRSWANLRREHGSR